MGCAWRQTSFWRNNGILWVHTLACTSRNSLAHNNLGLALRAWGRIDEAIAEFQQALELKFDLAQAHYNLGTVLGQAGRYDEAIVQLQQAVEITPNDVKAHNNLGMALAGRGRLDEAIAHYRKTLELMPDHANAHNNLARLLATCPTARLRNAAEAIEHARRASQLCDGRRPDVLDTLAAAYAEAGRFAEALATRTKPRNWPGSRTTRLCWRVCGRESHCTRPEGPFGRTHRLPCPRCQNLDLWWLGSVLAARMMYPRALASQLYGGAIGPRTDFGIRLLAGKSAGELECCVAPG